MWIWKFCQTPDVTRAIYWHNVSMFFQWCIFKGGKMSVDVFNLAISSKKWTKLQVNLFQKPSFLHELTHNMTINCSLNSPKVQNMLWTKIVFCFCIDIQNNICTRHVLNVYFSENLMENLWSIWVTDSRMRDSDTDLPVLNAPIWPIQAKTSSNQSSTHKVNSVQEACTKCFAVLVLKLEIRQTTWKN